MTTTADRRARTRTEDRTGTGWGWPFLATIGLAGFALITWVVASKIVIPFDQPLLDAASGLGQYMVAWRDLSDSANIPLIVIGVAIVAFLLFTRQRAEALLVIVLLAAVTAGSEAVKELTARPRPPGFDNNVVGVVYSYPSGHVLEAVVIYGIIAVLVWRSSWPTAVRVVIPIVFSVLIALVAIARVAVGAHYPSDVLAALLGGIGCLALFAIFTGMLARRRAAKAASASSPTTASSASSTS
ncbi:MAG TPA: phosphatase PAP2 family protein [Candidatus Limnocylindrales bacterium]